MFNLIVQVIAIKFFFGTTLKYIVLITLRSQMQTDREREKEGGKEKERDIYREYKKLGERVLSTRKVVYIALFSFLMSSNTFKFFLRDLDCSSIEFYSFLKYYLIEEIRKLNFAWSTINLVFLQFIKCRANCFCFIY